MTTATTPATPPPVTTPAAAFASVARECGTTSATIRKLYHWSGTTMDVDAWLDGRIQQEKTEGTTKVMAAKLLSQGIDVRRPATDGAIFRVGLVSGKVEKLTPWKHQVFLPAVARSERHALIRDFEYWHSLDGNQYARYLLVTSGERCSLAAMPERFEKMHAAFSELRALPEFQPGGRYASVEFVLRADEFTIRRDADFPDGLSFHAHMNVAYVTHQFLGGAEALRGLFDFIRAHFGTHCEDNGQITNVQELIKYVCKYEGSAKDKDDVGIAQLPADVLARLYEVRRGMKPVQCLGSLRDLRRRLAEKRLKTSRMPGSDGKRYLTVIDKEPAKERGPKQAFRKDNVLLCVTDPSPALSPMFEPCAMVRNFTATPEEVLFACQAPEATHKLAQFAREAAAFNQKREFQRKLEITQADADAAREAAQRLFLSDVHTFTESWEETQPVVDASRFSGDDHNRLRSTDPPDQ